MAPYAIIKKVSRAIFPALRVRIDSKKAIAEAKKRAGFTQAWDALEEEYSALSALLKARQKAGLTQEEVALRMGTTRSAISRLEGSRKHLPALTTLRRYAAVLGCDVEISLVPRSSQTANPTR